MPRPAGTKLGPHEILAPVLLGPTGASAADEGVRPTSLPRERKYEC